MNEESIAREVIGPKLAPYNPTNADAIDMALDLFNFNIGGASTGLIYDLGCGDGRFLIQACRRFPHLNGIGIEYDSHLVCKANDVISSNGMPDRVCFTN